MRLFFGFSNPLNPTTTRNAEEQRVSKSAQKSHDKFGAFLGKFGS
jgi:hypothetical protein